MDCFYKNHELCQPVGERSPHYIEGFPILDSAGASGCIFIFCIPNILQKFHNADIAWNTVCSRRLDCDAEYPFVDWFTAYSLQHIVSLRMHKARIIELRQLKFAANKKFVKF